MKIPEAKALGILSLSLLGQSFQAYNRAYKGRQEEQTPERRRLTKDEDANDYGTRCPYASPYWIGYA